MTAPVVEPIPERDKPIVLQDLQSYIAEFAPFDPSVPAQGPYEYPGLDELWRAPGRWPFWAKVEGEIAGFAFVHCKDGVADMAEFYIRSVWRRRGVGVAFARLVIARFPGPWTLSQYTAKTDSIAFWHRVIGTRPFTERDYVSANGNARVEQSFVA